MEVKEVKIVKKDNAQALEATREYKVVKANELIQKTRYSLSTQEQHIIAFLVSKIMPEDDDFHLYEFKIKDFCQVCDIDSTSGNNYANLKAALKRLADKSIWITLPDGRETLLRWIERPIISKRSGTIQIKLDELMKPYLLQLKDRFTQYELYYNLVMKSKYSIRLYELLKSYSNLSQWTFDIDELKKKLGAENYNRYPDFKRYVLDISLQEINDFSDLIVTIEVIKESRRYAKIKFFMQIKKDEKHQIQTFEKIDQAIGSNMTKLPAPATKEPATFQPSVSAPPVEKEKESPYLQENIDDEICRLKKLPYTYNSNSQRMEEAIHFMTEWNTFFPAGYKDELRQRVYNLFNAALIEMCCANKSMTLKGSKVTYTMVIDKLNQLAKFEDYYVDLSEFSELAMDNFIRGEDGSEIKNPLAYMKSCIWDAMQTGNVNMYADIRRNGF